jgi:hypothetical protein
MVCKPQRHATGLDGSAHCSGSDRSTRAAAVATAGPGHPCTTTLVRREFTAPVPNQLWLADALQDPACALDDPY